MSAITNNTVHQAVLYVGGKVSPSPLTQEQCLRLELIDFEKVISSIWGHTAMEQRLRTVSVDG